MVAFLFMETEDSTCLLREIGDEYTGGLRSKPGCRLSTGDRDVAGQYD
jgi:hypothetical protein